MSNTETVTDLFKVRHPKFRKEIPSDDSVKGDRFYGVEIEVEGCPVGYDTYTEMLQPRWEIKEDHSLRQTRQGRPYEFVTVPMKYSQVYKAISDFYRDTRFTEENFSDRCSIHVHANVTDFTLDNLSALSLYYQTIEDLLFEFVGNHRDTNLYCIPWSQCRMNHDLVTHLLDGSCKEKVRSWQKYTALNLLPIQTLGTVEFRQMHGTASVNKIHNWLAIINSLMIAASESNLEQASSEIKALATDKQYEKFFARFFGNTMVFDEHHRNLLDSGVINAKYSMVNFTKRAPVKASKSTSDILRDMVLEQRTIARDMAAAVEVAEGAINRPVDPRPPRPRAEIRGGRVVNTPRAGEWVQFNPTLTQPMPVARTTYEWDADTFPTIQERNN